MSTSFPRREQCLLRDRQTGPCAHRHPASVNQPDRKPPSRVPCVNRPSLRGRGAGPSEDARAPAPDTHCPFPCPSPVPVLLPVVSAPQEPLLSRLRAPTFPTSTPSPSTSICLFPRQVKRRANVPHWCFQQCRRGFLSLPGGGLAGHQVASSGAGLGAALRGADLIPAPTAPPAGLSVLPSGTVFTFPAAASHGPSPHCPAISPSSPTPSPPAPHPSSSLRDDPGPSLGSPPAQPWSVSSAHLCGQVRVPSRCSQRFTSTSSSRLTPCPVGMLHPHQAPKSMVGAGIRPAACTAVRPAVYTGMTLPQDAGKAALPRDVGRRTNGRAESALGSAGKGSRVLAAWTLPHPA